MQLALDLCNEFLAHDTSARINRASANRRCADPFGQSSDDRALKLVSIGRRCYLGGLGSYYDVLEAQQLLYPAEISFSETSRDQRLALAKRRSHHD